MAELTFAEAVKNKLVEVHNNERKTQKFAVKCPGYEDKVNYVRLQLIYADHFNDLSDDYKRTLQNCSNRAH